MEKLIPNKKYISKGGDRWKMEIIQEDIFHLVIRSWITNIWASHV